MKLALLTLVCYSIFMKLNVYLWMDRLFSTGFGYSNLFLRVTIYIYIYICICVWMKVPHSNTVVESITWAKIFHFIQHNIMKYIECYKEALDFRPWLATHFTLWNSTSSQTGYSMSKENEGWCLIPPPPIGNWLAHVLSVWQMVGGEGLKNYEGLMMSAERKVVSEDTVRNICFLCTAAHRWVVPIKTSNVS